MVPMSSIESHSLAIPVRLRTTHTPHLSTGPHHTPPRTLQRYWARPVLPSRVEAINPGGSAWKPPRRTPGKQRRSRKAGYRDHTFHQERDLFPAQRHRRRRDGAHLLRSRLPHTSAVDRSAEPPPPITQHRPDSGSTHSLGRGARPTVGQLTDGWSHRPVVLQSWPALAWEAISPPGSRERRPISRTAYREGLASEPELVHHRRVGIEVRADNLKVLMEGGQL